MKKPKPNQPSLPDPGPLLARVKREAETPVCKLEKPDLICPDCGYQEIDCECPIDEEDAEQ